MYQTPYSYPNPYQNLQAPQFQMPSYHQQQVTKVNGRNGAEAYQMSPNSSALLLDEHNPIVWLAQTDGAGYKTITAYDIQLHQDAPPVDTQDLLQRVTRLEEKINESYSSNAKQWKYDGSSKTNGTNAQVSKQSTTNG
jgi:hypothetical protein